MSTNWDKLVSDAKGNLVWEVQTKTRTFLQGLTLQSADEVEAFFRGMVNDKGYEETLKETQQSIKDYHSTPGESLAYEAGGALSVVAAASPITGGSSGVVATAASGQFNAIAKGLGFKNSSSFTKQQQRKVLQAIWVLKVI